ncbi:MAG: FG-GAP repeat domain-containing protein, partial [Limisphaerales bacterium]
MNLFRVVALLIGLCFLGTNHLRAAGYGFSGPEIFPINSDLYGLDAADLDGDGLNDLAVVNNVRSRITLLYNRTGKKKRKNNRVFDPNQVNQLPPDARFERKSILADVRIGGMMISDFNGDGRPDIALFGEPKKFQFIANKGNQEWAEPVSWELEASLFNLNAIDAGDLNGDGLKDVVILAEHFAFLFRQKKDGGFEDPLKIPFSGAAKAVRILDVNLDGRHDFVTLDWDSDSPVRVRTQTKSGVLGPEMQLKYPKFRAFESADIDGDGALEWLTIGQQSGRMQVGRFRENGSVEGLSRPLMFTPLLRTSAASRGVIWADLNSDGRSDLVYAESDQGLLQARLQNKDGRLEPARRFPSLTGVTTIESADFDGDNSPELFVFSPEEKQVGMINVGKDGRLPFPELFAFQGRPLAMALGRVGAHEDLTLAVLLDDEGKRSLYLRTAKDKGRTVALSKDFRASPAQ